MSSTQDQGSEKTKINLPFQWNTAGLNRSIKSIRFVADDDGAIWGYPVIIAGANSSNNELVVSDIEKANSDTISSNQVGILTRSLNYLIKPGATYAIERQRTPTIFANASAITGAGDNIVWNPAAGKRFRLMGFTVIVSKEAACAGAFYISVKDQGTAFYRLTVSTAALVAIGQPIQFTYNFPGNGYLSTAEDNNLILDLNGALTAGSVSINYWGCEE